MPVLTDSLVTVSDALLAICLTNQTLWGIQDIFYGDQERIPRNPALCIETGEKHREMGNAPRGVNDTFTIYIIIYHNPLSDTQVTRRDNDMLAETIQTALEANKDLGGIVIHGYVTSLEPGYQLKSGTMYRATRITYEAMSKVQLPYS